MKRLAVLIICAVSLLGCKEKAPDDPTEAPRYAFLDAFTALRQHDYGKYMESVDIGEPLDTFHYDFMYKSFAQHQDWQEKTKGPLVDVEVVDAKMLADSVCMLCYKLMFTDNSEEISSQKMVRSNGVWKLRLRN